MNEKYLLIDADSKIPNLALMKISTFLKKKGYNVDIIKCNISYYPNRKKEKYIDADKYKGVFVSYIFENSKNYLKIINNNNILEGGIGVSFKKRLHPSVEELYPDYSIYPENDTSYGFITRGCIRNCKFCKVPKKEGVLYFNQHPKDIIKHKKVKFLDNNFLAYKNHVDILVWLIENNIKFQFNQGLDIRLLNEENSQLLGICNYLGEYLFAFDNLKDEELIQRKLDIFKKYIKKDWGIKFFIYCNANMNIFSDVIYRVNWCYKNKVLPYLMRDINCWESNNCDFYIDLCAWCNQPNLFKTMSFKEYIQKRQNKNLDRQKRSLNLYLGNIDK